jgi:hypothetical protein
MLEGLKTFLSRLEGPGPMCLIRQFVFMQVLAKAANGAAIGSTLAASSCVSRKHGEKGEFAQVLQER